MIQAGMLILSSLCVPIVAVTDAPFVQEHHECHAVANDVRAVAVDGAGNVWAAAKAGVYVLKKGATEWSQTYTGTAFTIAVDNEGVAWIGTWDGLYREASKVAGVDGPIAAVTATENGIAAAGFEGLWHVVDGAVSSAPLGCSRNIRSALAAPGGGLWFTTAMGLAYQKGESVTTYQTPGQLVSCDVRGMAYAPDNSLWIGSLGGITVFRDGVRTGHFTPAEGLPSIDVQCVARAPDGRMWVGTALGVARYADGAWSLRHSKRWLAGDDVRDVAFDADGTAWVATDAGVSAIKQRAMTLAEKASLLQTVCMERHVREPWLVEKCRLTVPGDTSTWEPEDDDNDGQYTAMYLMGESFRYAATKDPYAKDKSKKAFDALRYLQTVTETPGFIARTVIPSTWTRMHDPGDKFTDQELAEHIASDPRYKEVKVRWHPSRDGKWLWKGDTSSDEMTGHFCGYGYYYDLAADDAAKEEVRVHVRNVMDYIIDGGYVLKDIDGTHTRWGVWSPEKLNNDPDWAAERGCNSVEILSYLKTAYHVTDDEKYEREYLRLLHEHGYTDNVRHAKTYGPAWRTHIDDELLMLAFPALLNYEKDPELLALYRESLDYLYKGLKGDCSPYFEFTYGSLGGACTALEESVAFLRDAPLDCVNWRVDNSKREDIRLVRVPEFESVQTNRILPASERGIMRWDKNPWVAVQGDGGHSERCPSYWLLPYWMGRYYGYIDPPSGTKTE